MGGRLPLGGPAIDFIHSRESLSFFQPELVLTGLILLVVLMDLSKRISKGMIAAVAALGLVGVLTILAWGIRNYPVSPARSVFGPGARLDLYAVTMPGAAIFDGAAAYDPFSLFFKAAFALATLAVIVFSARYVGKWRSGQGETYALLLACCLGMFLMASARSLLMMYLSLEFVSVTSYVMAGLRPRNRKSAEASLKYIIYGAAASGVMLYGISYLYLTAGTLDIGEIGARMKSMSMNEYQLPTLITATLVMAGFGYKIAAVPFHMWCPDVYEGSPTAITAFFSVGPKAAGFAMLIRFFAGVFGVYDGTSPYGGPLPEWQVIVALMAVLTMAVGNFGALHQQNLKRLLAYSSIAHAGYMLLALCVFTPATIGALMLYVFVYLIMNLGAFFVVMLLEEHYRIETVDACKGLGWRSPALCGLMTLFLIALTGIPPTAGFIGKLYVFGGIIDGGGGRGVALAVVGVLFSVISLVYYARIFGVMFLQRPSDEAPALPALPRAPMAIVWLLGAATLILGIWFEWLYRLSLSSGTNLLS